MINRRTRRWTAILLLAMLAFAQASVALAACSMDRGMLASTMAMSAGDDCDGCDMSAQAAMDSTNQCVVHCTADLQLAGAPPDAAVAGPAETLPAVAVLRFRSPLLREYLLPGAPPRRILLHSFQL